MISSDVIRGYIDTIILSVLLEGDSYGYAVSKRIRELTDEKYVIKETTLYSAFSRLEASGYIEAYYGSETGGKRRTYYRVTDTGRRYYREKCGEWRVTQEVISKFIKETEADGNDPGIH